MLQVIVSLGKTTKEQVKHSLNQGVQCSAMLCDALWYSMMPWNALWCSVILKIVRLDIILKYWGCNVARSRLQYCNVWYNRERWGEIKRCLEGWGNVQRGEEIFRRVEKVVLGDGERYKTLWGHNTIWSNARQFRAIGRWQLDSRAYYEGSKRLQDLQELVMWEHFRQGEILMVGKTKSGVFQRG